MQHIPMGCAFLCFVFANGRFFKLRQAIHDTIRKYLLVWNISVRKVFGNFFRWPFNLCRVFTLCFWFQLNFYWMVGLSPIIQFHYYYATFANRASWHLTFAKSPEWLAGQDGTIFVCRADLTKLTQTCIWNGLISAKKNQGLVKLPLRNVSFYYEWCLKYSRMIKNQ